MKYYNGRYQRQRPPSPQVVNVKTTEQPAWIIEETPNIHSDNLVQQLSTIKYIKDKLNTEKTWSRLVMSQQLVKLLAPLRYYKSKSQYYPTENMPHLDVDDLSNVEEWGCKYSVLEIWEKESATEWLLIPMLTYFRWQLIFACNKSLCQSMPCPDSWKQWPNQLSML